MRHKIKKMVEIEVCVNECDFCNHKTEGKVFTMNSCCVCNRDTCREHTYWHEEYHMSDIYITTCPACHKIMEKAWEWAIDNAGRYESLRDVAIKRFHELKEELEQT